MEVKNSLVKDLEYINECNKVIKKTMTQYSEELKNIIEPTNEQYCDAKPDISYTLLHDVILMEVRSMTFKYEASKKREKGKQRTRIEKRIDEIHNSNREEDNLELETCKTELQDLVDKRDTEEARKSLAKYNLECKHPTKFFCSLKCCM